MTSFTLEGSGQSKGHTETSHPASQDTCVRKGVALKGSGIIVAQGAQDFEPSQTAFEAWL